MKVESMIGIAGLLLLAAGGDPLARSLYVPVEIRLCEHLKDAVLYRGDEPLRRLPGKQVFQFTFFPALSRIEPELDRVVVEGQGFRTELIVTPASVYVGTKKIDLDVGGQLAHLRHHTDTRHETVKLTLRCPTACARAGAAPSDSR
jgi:hypothetical protein